MQMHAFQALLHVKNQSVYPFMTDILSRKNNGKQNKCEQKNVNFEKLQNCRYDFLALT